jgi:hypothetical protein
VFDLLWLAVATSIGFGNISPITTYGKILTVLICVIGMPMAVQSICKSGEVLFGLLIRSPLRAYSSKPACPKRQLALVSVFCLLYWLAGIVLYRETMKWGALDCAYYLFIATSTVGYGDLIPNGRYYALDLVFTVFGLNLVSLFFQVETELGEERLKEMALKIEEKRAALAGDFTEAER